MPTLYSVRAFAEDGGLMAYPFDEVELYSRAADQVAQILKGAKVEDIPFYRATTFKLTINIKTAKALGILTPPAVFIQADEVIE